MNKKLIILLLCIFSSSVYMHAKEAVSVELRAKTKQKMPLLFVYIGAKDSAASALMDQVKKLLTFSQFSSEGFAVSVDYTEANPKKEMIKQLAKKGYPLVVYVSKTPDAQFLNYRVYDTYTLAMMAGKKISLEKKPLSVWPTLLADSLWKDLTNKDGIFSTHIAYCKEEKANGTLIKNIYINSPFGTEKEAHCFLKGGRLLAPRWNHDLENPLLLFSRCTNKNICLHAATMDKQCSLVSDFDGLNMLPAFSSNGEKVVYCLSLEGRAQLYLCEFNETEQRKVLRRITNNIGNNVSPSVADNGDIIFCSDFKTGKPEIFYYHHASKQYERIAGGFCSSPQWSEAKKSIVYSKAINGVMQLFSYDTNTKQHTQITFDPGEKEESCWSPCGNYIAYCVDTKKQSRIAVMNMASKEYSFITHGNQRCSYPSWSPRYYSDIILS